MNNLPKRIIRLDDGAEFVLDERLGTYSMKLDIPNYVGHQYTYERLMEDPRSKGAFKVADGTEDLVAMKKAWLDSIVDNNDGHGNEE